jgi:hypothetical protein
MYQLAFKGVIFPLVSATQEFAIVVVIYTRSLVVMESYWFFTVVSVQSFVT